MRPQTIIHCDWSTAPAGRWQCRATRQDGGWHVAPPAPVGPLGDFVETLRGLGENGGVLAGFDLPIGLPLAYADRLELKDFPAFLALLGTKVWQTVFSVAREPHEIGLHRPFYPDRPGGRRRAHLLEGLGIGDWDQLHRACERATPNRTAGAPLFWTLGGNQVGKAALSAWRDVLRPLQPHAAFWPFDGDLLACLAARPVVVAETYPGDVYHRLGIPRRPVWSKTREAGRMSVAAPLIDWLRRHAPHSDKALFGHVAQGFGTGTRGADPFDALVGLMGMIDVVEGRRDEGPADDPLVTRFEGWIFGQSASPNPTISGGGPGERA